MQIHQARYTKPISFFAFILVVSLASSFVQAKVTPIPSGKKKALKKKAKKMATDPKRRAKEQRAKALFTQAEKARSVYLSLQFPNTARGAKRALKQMIKEGRKLHKKYSLVPGQGVPKWTLATMFRMHQVWELFAQKLYNAPVPKGLPKRLHLQYKTILETRALALEERAAKGYKKVIAKAKQLKLQNKWVCWAQKRLHTIKKRAKKAAALRCNPILP